VAEVMMYAKRYLLETDDQGHLTESPKLPPRARLEAFFVVIDESRPERGRSASEPPPGGSSGNAQPEAGRSKEAILFIADDFDAPLDDFRDYH
jgi:hypothetical protein